MSHKHATHELDPTFHKKGRSPSEFFARNPYFRIESFRLNRSKGAAARALQYHVAQGNLVNVRKGTYIWKTAAKLPSPFLLGTYLVRDTGTIAYASALWWHGLIPAQKTITVLSADRLADFKFAGVTYRAVRPPRPLGDLVFSSGGVKLEYHLGLLLPVTTPERAFVDCLDRLDLHGLDLDALWSVFRAQEKLDTAELMRHALALGNRVAIARLGLLLDCHPHTWRQQPKLSQLQANLPKTAALMDPSRHPVARCTYWPKWRLLVPSRFYERLKANR